MSSPPTATTLGAPSSRPHCIQAVHWESNKASGPPHPLLAPRAALSGPRKRGLKLKPEYETTPTDAHQHPALPAFDGRKRGDRSRASYHLHASIPVAQAYEQPLRAVRLRRDSPPC